MTRRPSHPLLVVAIATATALVGLAGPATAPALAAGSTITVNTVAHTMADDGTCSFIEAIAAANSNTASGATPGECPAGSGADTIRFAPQIDVEPVDFYSGGPDIESDLTIDGGGVVTLDLGGLGHMRRNSGVVVVKGITIQNGQNGGIWNQAPGSLLVDSSRITGTAAGPGIYNVGTLIVHRTTIDRNDYLAADGGGLLNATDGTATVTDSHISDNHALNGGGIFNRGTLTVRRTTLDLNGAELGGGLYNAGSASISASTFATNAASASGGGVLNGRTTVLETPSLALDNVTLYDNRCNSGAAVSNGSGGGGTLTMVNSTVTANVAEPGGYNAVSTWQDVAVKTTVRNSIIAGNSMNDVGGKAFEAASGHNQIGPLAGAVPLSTYLSIAGLQDNGGPTRTVALVNSATNPFATGGDPALCAVDPVGGVDQRGVKRPAGTCSIGAVQLERSKPTAGAPASGLQATSALSFDALIPIVQLSGTSGRARITWSGNDNSGGSGVRDYQVSRSVNGGSWSTVAAAATAKALDTTVTPGKRYRFRVRAIDHDGNVSSWAYGSTFTASLVQQTSSSFRYGGRWSSSSSALYSGGSARFAKAAGASVSRTATGRAFAFVTTMGPGRGKARIYVDGKLKTTVDLVAQVTFHRAQAWSIRFPGSASHTVKVVVVGTSGRPRVEVDAFLVLR